MALCSGWLDIARCFFLSLSIFATAKNILAQLITLLPYISCIIPYSFPTSFNLLFVILYSQCHNVPCTTCPIFKSVWQPPATIYSDSKQTSCFACFIAASPAVYCPIASLTLIPKLKSHTPWTNFTMTLVQIIAAMEALAQSLLHPSKVCYFSTAAEAAA